MGWNGPRSPSRAGRVAQARGRFLPRAAGLLPASGSGSKPLAHLVVDKEVLFPHTCGLGVPATSARSLAFLSQGRLLLMENAEKGTSNSNVTLD